MTYVLVLVITLGAPPVKIMPVAVFDDGDKCFAVAAEIDLGPHGKAKCIQGDMHP